jgi:tight adherence protein B
MSRLGHPVEPSPWVMALAAELGGRVSPAQLRAALHAAAVVVPLVTGVLLHPGVAVLLLGAGIAAPRLTAPLLHRRRNERRDAQLAAAIERIAASVRAGASLTSALDEVAHDCAEPLGAELRVVAHAVRSGELLAGALDAWVASAGGSGDVALAGAALGLGARAGGPVARALDGVAATLRERRQLQA